MSSKSDGKISVSKVRPEDLREFNESMGLYLKPIAKITITVQLPAMRMANQSISTWEVIEKLKKRARPHNFKSLTVIKSTLEQIRFEGDFDSKTTMEFVLPRIDKSVLKLSGFAEQLKVSAGAVKIGSTRHQWEAYFRDNPHMDETKPGHRPDTLYIKNLPVKWFGGNRPKATMLIDAFKTFGEIRRFYIPILDELNDPSQTASSLLNAVGFKKFSHKETLYFDAYIMFRDYIGFVKAMDALRAMKLVKHLTDARQYLEYDIEVDFDREKQLSDRAIKKRKLNREYGIKNTTELKELKEETKRQRKNYEQRIIELNIEKEKAKQLLSLILSKLEMREKQRKQHEEREEIERKLKQRLLNEENKLREKLIEKRREKLKQQLAGQKLSSVAGQATSSLTKNDNVHYKTHKQSYKHKPKSLVIRKEPYS